MIRKGADFMESSAATAVKMSSDFDFAGQSKLTRLIYYLMGHPQMMSEFRSVF